MEAHPNKKNLLFIGANDMSEIESYIKEYQNGIFIEAIPWIYNEMVKKLDRVNKLYKTNYIGLNCLVSSEEGKEYTFNIFSNQGASSSIYEPNPETWAWDSVKKVDTMVLKSTTIEQIIKDQKWEQTKYDVILDTQGAELDVLKGFGDSNFPNIESLQTEISTKEYYIGGVLFETLNDFLISKKFQITSPPHTTHCDVKYLPVR